MSEFSTRDNNGVSTLTWHQQGKVKHIEKSYVDDEFLNYYPIGFIPPFQYVREDRFFNAEPVPPIDSFKLIRCDTGQEIEILNTIESDHGLVIIESDSYDGFHIISNPSTNVLSEATINQDNDFGFIVTPDPEGSGSTSTDVQYEHRIGMYKVVMVSGTSTLESEPFVWVGTTNNLLKITYWHDRAFPLPYGQINYAEPFRNIAYLDAELGKPDWPNEEEVQRRGGHVFPIQQTSTKEHRFSLPLPEHIIDAVSKIWQHRFIVIEFQGAEYFVNRFVMSSPSWDEKGDVAAVDFAFYTNTVTIVNGASRIPTSSEYAATVYVDEL